MSKNFKYRHYEAKNMQNLRSRLDWTIFSIATGIGFSMSEFSPEINRLCNGTKAHKSLHCKYYETVNKTTVN